MPFQKGVVSNPKGRPKGTKNKFSVPMLQKAFARAAKEKKQTILDNLALKAYSDNKLAVSLLKFMMPSLKQIEVLNDKQTIWSEKTPEEILAAMVLSSAPPIEEIEEEI
jgi:hypothetical protein